MKYVLRSAVVVAAVFAAAPALSAEYQRDGQLPMYPHSVLDAKEASVTPGAIAQGVPLVLLTPDSVGTVVSWYVSHAARACHRQDASGGTKFGCPGGSIIVYAKDGRTQIALVPPLPGL